MAPEAFPWQQVYKRLQAVGTNKLDEDKTAFFHSQIIHQRTTI